MHFLPSFSHTKAILTICLLTFILYIPSLFGEFVWDDHDFILNNTSVTQPHYGALWTSQPVAGAQRISSYYRPIQFSLYALLYDLIGPNPAYFHLLSVVLHVLASVSVYGLLLILTHQPWIALPSTVLFALHPVHTESVSYISGLSDSLAVFWGNTGIILYLVSVLYTLNIFRAHFSSFIKLLLFISCIFCIGLSLLSKEIGLVYICLIVILQVLNPNKLIVRSRTSWLLTICLLFIAAGYLFWHMIYIQTPATAAAFPDSYRTDVFLRLSTFVTTIPTYLQLLFFPTTLHMDRDATVIIPTQPSVLLLSLYTLLLIGGTYICIRRYRTQGLILFFWLAMLISMAPFTGLIPINGLFYEHYLYAPSIWWFALWSTVLTQAPSTKRILILICLLLVPYFSIRTLSQQHIWISEERLLSHTLQHVPHSERAANNLGSYYLRTNRYPEAQTILLKYVDQSHLPHIPTNLALTFLIQGNASQAAYFAAKAFVRDPDFLPAQTVLSKIYESYPELTK